MLGIQQGRTWRLSALRGPALQEGAVQVSVVSCHTLTSKHDANFKNQSVWMGNKIPYALCVSPPGMSMSELWSIHTGD